MGALGGRVIIPRQDDDVIASCLMSPFSVLITPAGCKVYRFAALVDIILLCVAKALPKIRDNT